MVTTFIGLMVVYYYGFAESRQYFSEVEQKKFMKAYVLNANNRKKKSGTERFLADFKKYFSIARIWHNVL